MRLENFEEGRIQVKALEKLPTYQALSYRGFMIPRHLEEIYTTAGSIIADPGFTEASRDLKFALNRHEGEGLKALLIINGKTGRAIEGLSAHPDEKEILFKPEVILKNNLVHQMRDGTYVIFANEEVPQSKSEAGIKNNDAP